MDTVKELAGLAVMTVLFSLFTWALVDSYMEEYDFASIEPATAMVLEKKGAKGLFMPPSYYVRVHLPSEEEAPYLNRISKKQMKTLKTGDRISGYSSGPSDFSTIRDILFDSAIFLVGIFVLGMIAFCSFVALILSIPAVERAEERASTKRRIEKRKKKRRKGKKWKKERKWKGWGIVAAVIALFSVFIVRYVWNLWHKLMPFGKTEARALIIDRTADVSYRRREDSIYELDLMFRDSDGQNVEVLREVTAHTYSQYATGDMLPIVYCDANPYDVFVRGTSLWDTVQALSYYEVYFYLVAIAVTGFVGWVFWGELRKRKTQNK